MTIHAEHPFADPHREAGRQLRGRVGARVSVLTAGEGRGRAAWTVSSYAVVAGDPWRLVAFVDPDSDLADVVQQTGRAVVQFLHGGHRYLADACAGLAPAPGGVFTLDSWEQTSHGPRLVSAGSWATLILESATPVGWLLQLTLTLDEVHTDEDDEPLHHRRGNYLVLS